MKAVMSCWELNLATCRKNVQIGQNVQVLMVSRLGASADKSKPKNVWNHLGRLIASSITRHPKFRTSRPIASQK